MSGKYGGVLSKNKELYKQSLQQIYPALTPDQKMGVDRFIGKSNVDQFYAHQAFTRQQAAADAKNAMLQDSLTAELTASGKMQVPPDNYPDQGTFKLSGAYKKDPKTGQIELDDAGNRISTPNFDPTTAHNTYDFISKDGTVLAENVSADSKKKYESLHLERGYQNGTFAAKANDQVQAGIDAKYGMGPKPQTQQQAPAAPAAPAPTTLTKPVEPGVDPFVSQFKTSLNASDAQMEKIGAPVDDLKRTVDLYARDATARNDPSTQVAISHKVDTIVRSITDDEFDSSPAIQSQNTEADVERYNKGQWDEIMKPAPGWANMLGVGGMVEEHRKAIYDLAKLNTPKDLYYSKRSTPLVTKMNGFIKKAAEDASSRASSTFKSQKATQQNLNYLNSEANASK
jgi:hypothetical protein